MEDNIFIEKLFYIDPPDLPKSTTKSKTEKVWKDWLNKNAKERSKHKRRWTLSQEPTDIYLTGDISVIKIDGIWQQRLSMVGLSGYEDNISLILSVSATQDKHFCARGSRAGGSSQKNSRAKKRKSKRQKILNRVKK